MGINNTIWCKIKDTLRDDLYEEWEVIEDIRVFLASRCTNDRRDRAAKIIKGILQSHDKGKPGDLVRLLGLLEIGSESVRDHVVHTLLCYLLGVYLTKEFPPVQCVDPFQWKLAALFHDVGYIAQLAANHLMEPVTNLVNATSDSGVYPPAASFQVLPVGLERLTGTNNNGLRRIQGWLHKWHLPPVTADTCNMLLGTRHGPISAMVTLRAIDVLYEQDNPKRERQKRKDNGVEVGRRVFENDVAPACAAIFAHDLPMANDQKMNVGVAPLPFLLRLADCLQEWWRPSADFSGWDDDCFDVNVNGGKLVFSVAGRVRTRDQQSQWKCQRKRIERGIKDSLVVNGDIEVRSLEE